MCMPYHVDDGDESLVYGLLAEILEGNETQEAKESLETLKNNLRKGDDVIRVELLYLKAIENQNRDMVHFLHNNGFEIDHYLVAGMANTAGMTVPNTPYPNKIEFESECVRGILDDFVEWGWDINALPSQSPCWGFTYPIMHAISKPHFLSWMLERGASVHVRNHSTHGPISVCAATSTVGCMRTIFGHGAEPEDEAIHEVLKRNSIQGSHRLRMLSLLLEHGVDINALETEKPFTTNGALKPIKRKTPLHAAIGTGDIQSVMFLVERGANVEARQLVRWPYTKFTEGTSGLEEMRLGSIEIRAFAEGQFGPCTDEEKERIRRLQNEFSPVRRTR